MSETPPDAELPGEPEPPTLPPAERPVVDSRWRPAALALAGALVVVVVLVASAPFWAPLLPWGIAAPDNGREQELASRLDQLAATQQALQQQVKQAADAANALSQRPQQPNVEMQAALQRVDQRIAALEQRPSVSPDDVADLRKQLTGLTNAVPALSARLDALEKAAHDTARHDVTETALPLVLLQIRDAVAAGRPFGAEYATLSGLARSRPDLAQAAAPLADPAKTGVATYTVLDKGLHDLGTAVTAAKPAVKPRNWRQRMLASLSGLVTIRRVDQAGAPVGGSAQAVNAAQLALAGGDLASAIAAVAKLDGATSEAAAPWLRLARQRLAVDTALRQVETLLAARLGNPAAPTPPG